MKNFTFLLPVYDDWTNLKLLLENIDKEILNLYHNFDVIILNDFSKIKHEFKNEVYKKFNKIRIIHFNRNLGSQRAIAIGLKYISQNYENTNVIIMDADGQDDPSILPKIISYTEENQEDIITINRSQRNEGLWFRILYECHYYSLILFSGYRIRFGNYSLINSNKIKQLTENGNLWAAYPAAVISTFKKTKRIFHIRKKRFSGNTKMNFFKLLKHSIRVFSVFKIKVLLSSLVMSIILYILGDFFNSVLAFPIFFLIIGNCIIFIASLENKKKYLDNFTQVIESEENIK